MYSNLRQFTIFAKCSVVLVTALTSSDIGLYAKISYVKVMWYDVMISEGPRPPASN